MATKPLLRSSAALDRHLGVRLARRRLELSLTAADLEEIISASAGSIAGFESGAKNIGAAQLFLLSRALGVPVGYFFEGSPAGSVPNPQSMPEPGSVEEVEKFLKAYFKVPDSNVRRDILGLIKAEAGGGKTAPAR